MYHFLLLRSLRSQPIPVNPITLYAEIPISSLDPGIPSLKEHVLIGFIPSTDLFLTIPIWSSCGLSIWRYGEPASLVYSIDRTLSDIVRVETASNLGRIYQLVFTKDFLEFRIVDLETRLSLAGMSVSSLGMVCWKYLSKSNMMVVVVDDIAVCYPIRRRAQKWEEADENGLLRINFDLYLEEFMTLKLRMPFRILNFKSIIVDTRDNMSLLDVVGWTIRGSEQLVWVLLVNLLTGDVSVTEVKKYHSIVQIDFILVRLGLKRHSCNCNCLGNTTKVLETYESEKPKGVEKIVWEEGARVITGWD